MQTRLFEWNIHLILIALGMEACKVNPVIELACAETIIGDLSAPTQTFEFSVHYLL